MWLLTVTSLALLAGIKGAPQFDDTQRPMPYNFEYGVNVDDTKDAKEHKESTSETGRTEGMYRWLQPNGLYMVVRYFVDGDSGFQAEVSEEPGPEIQNYYNDDRLTGAAGSSVGSQINLRQNNNIQFQQEPQQIVTNENLFSNQQQTFTSNNNQQFSSQQNFQNDDLFLNSADNFNFNQQTFSTNENQKSFSSSSRTSSQSNDFIDGGIIEGQVIDGGIINPEALKFK